MSDVTTPVTNSDWEVVDDFSWILLDCKEFVDVY